MNKSIRIVSEGSPKPLCVLFLDTKGIQWADTDASDKNDPRKPIRSES